jgi:dTDP-4-amino-4,6-dideoxygalactose transaminase
LIVPFIDLAKRSERFLPAVLEAVHSVAEGNTQVLGPNVEEFEKQWAKFCRRKYCVGVASGFDALGLALLAKCGSVGRGEVIVAGNGYMATWMAVSAAGMIPIPVDPDADTYNVDEVDDQIFAQINENTKAIVLTDLYGKQAAAHRFAELGIPVIVDAAQSHGLTPVVDVACYSFYPTKNLGALGDAGAVVTDDERLAAQLRLLRSYGQDERDSHQIIGFNSRLDEIQAAILLSKLPGLAADNIRRNQNANAYFAKLGECAEIKLPSKMGANSWHLFVIRHSRRDELRQKLFKAGISTGVHYPTPPHQQKAYSQYGGFVLPISEAIAEECISLPVGPEITVEQVHYVAEQICDLA